MAQTKLLIDSNSYFRLAKSLHPLLFEEFGADNYCLYVLKELEEEWSRNPRLTTKFAWVSEDEYRENRKKLLLLSKKEQKQLPTVFEFIWQEARSGGKTPSRVDTQYLAYGYVLGITVITDDLEMREVAKQFGIDTRNSLELMELMYRENQIDISKVRQIAAYWTFEGDKPAGFRTDYIRLFNEEPRVT